MIERETVFAGAHERLMIKLPPCFDRSTCTLITSSSHSKSHGFGFPAIRRRLFKLLQSCAILSFGLLLCVSFVAFALCTVEGSMHLAGKRSLPEMNFLGYRGRLLMQEADSRGYSSFSQFHVENLSRNALSPCLNNCERALHGLGSVYMKGTKAMPNLIIANLDDSLDLMDFRLFLRTLYNSGTMSSADLVFLFPWPSLPQNLCNILKEEENYYFRKMNAMKINVPAHSGSVESLKNSEDISERTRISEEISESQNRNKINVKRGRAQTFWGPTLQEGLEQTNLFDSNHGSVVGFSVGDLDPADTFSEFLSSPSPQMRRWLCYEMLLGLLRFKFRLVLLVELGGVVVLRDVFAKAKQKDFLYLTLQDSTWADMATESDYVLLRSRKMLNRKHIRDTKKRRSACKRCSIERQRYRNMSSEAEGAQLSDGRSKAVSDGVKMQGLMEAVYGREVWNSLEQVEKQSSIISSRIILSSMRAARGLARSMSVEIVRVALQRGNKLAFPDRAILSHLVQKSPHLLGRRAMENLQLMRNSDSEIHDVENLKPEDVLQRSKDVQNYSVLHASSLSRVQKSTIFQNQHNESNVTASLLLLASICTSTIDASDFYPDCSQKQVQIALAMLKS